MALAWQEHQSAPTAVGGFDWIRRKWALQMSSWEQKVPDQWEPTRQRQRSATAGRAHAAVHRVSGVLHSVKVQDDGAPSFYFSNQSHTLVPPSVHFRSYLVSVTQHMIPDCPGGAQRYQEWRMHVLLCQLCLMCNFVSVTYEHMK